MNTLDKVRIAREHNPMARAIDIARDIGVSREMVRQSLVKLGLPTRIFGSYRRIRAEHDNNTGGARYLVGMPTGTVGAISESFAAAHLMIAGFDVFKALSQHAICDLVVVSRETGASYRVEVKSGKINNAEKILSGQIPAHKKNRCDIHAVVLRDGSVHFFPQLDRLTKTLDK